MSELWMEPFWDRGERVRRVLRAAGLIEAHRRKVYNEKDGSDASKIHVLERQVAFNALRDGVPYSRAYGYTMEMAGESGLYVPGITYDYGNKCETYQLGVSGGVRYYPPRGANIPQTLGDVGLDEMARRLEDLADITLRHPGFCTVDAISAAHIAGPK